MCSMQSEAAKGKIGFLRMFKSHLETLIDGIENIEWDDNQNFNKRRERLRINVKGREIHIEVKEDDLADFGAGGPEQFRIDLLHRKQEEVLDKLEQ